MPVDPLRFRLVQVVFETDKHGVIGDRGLHDFLIPPPSRVLDFEIGEDFEQIEWWRRLRIVAVEKYHFIQFDLVGWRNIRRPIHIQRTAVRLGWFESSTVIRRQRSKVSFVLHVHGNIRGSVTQLVASTEVQIRGGQTPLDLVQRTALPQVRHVRVPEIIILIYIHTERLLHDVRIQIELISLRTVATLLQG